MIEALKIHIGNRGKRFIIKRIRNIFKTNYGWTNGKNVEEFEKSFSDFIGAKHTIAVSSGSSAIETAIYALGLEEGDIAFVPTLTAPPTVYSCLHAGLRVVLIDCDEDDLGMDLNDLKAKIGRYEYKKGVVIPVHVGGLISRNIKNIVELSHEKKLFVIEDCAHAHGSKLDGIQAGTIGDVAVFSFFLTKVLTCGEGGAVVTNDEVINEKSRIIRNYGKFNGKHIMRGSSWRMNEFTAAVALWQAKNADKIIGGRRKVANYYSNRVRGINTISVLTNEENLSYYKYIIKMNPEIVQKVKKYFTTKKIMLPGEVYSLPCHKEPVFSENKNILNIDDSFDKAESFSHSHICLPIYPGIKKKEMKKIVDCLMEAINARDI